MGHRNEENKIFKMISYNTMSDGNCSGLLTLIDIEKPDVILLHEIVLDTEHLCTFLASKRGYRAESNTDPLEPNKPGTALIWMENIPVTRVASIEPRRLQTAFMGPYPVVNIYPPAGSDNGSDNAPGRRDMFYFCCRVTSSSIVAMGSETETETLRLRH